MCISMCAHTHVRACVHIYLHSCEPKPMLSKCAGCMCAYACCAEMQHHVCMPDCCLRQVCALTFRVCIMDVYMYVWRTGTCLYILLKCCMHRTRTYVCTCYVLVCAHLCYSTFHAHI